MSLEFANEKLSAEPVHNLAPSADSIVNPSPSTVPNCKVMFTPFHGQGSTWNIDGMDKMSTVEYYAALNKRNAEIQAYRKQSGLSGPRDVDDYLASLNGKK
jgi:hypothetical protein